MYAAKKYGISVQIWIPMRRQVFCHISFDDSFEMPSIKLLSPPVKRIHNLSPPVKTSNGKYIADVAKLWQWDGIAAVEAESRGKIQFFMANEGRSSVLNHRHERSLV
jgi:hypothetical protein